MGFSEAFTVLAEASTARRVSGTLSGLGVAVVLVALSPIIMGCNTTETVYINPGGGGSTGGSTGEDAPTTTGTSNGSGTTGGETTGGPDDAGTSSTGTTGGDLDASGFHLEDGKFIPTTTGDGCGEVSPAGCCQGTLLQYCKAGALVELDCSVGDPPNCGWDQSFYNCENNGGEDPSGASPIACP